MIYTKESKKSVKTISSQVEESAKEHGFGILKIYDFKKILKEKGFPIEKNITVFELCNPQAAQKALNLHPEISVYLPCRISIYQKESKTIISTINIEEIMGSFAIDDTFKEYMENVFNRLKNLMDSLK